jgi:hypothetical protein
VDSWPTSRKRRDRTIRDVDTLGGTPLRDERRIWVSSENIPADNSGMRIAPLFRTLERFDHLSGADLGRVVSIAVSVGIGRDGAQ